MNKIRYQKVKFRDGDDERAVFLRITSDTARVLSGVEVDREGEEIEPPGYSHRLRMIDKQFIIWRREYTMDLHYGELKPGKALCK